MARSQSMLYKEMQGRLGKDLVIKQYGKKTVVSNYPDMSNVKPSKEQKNKRKLFAKAVAYAREIINDPAKRTAFQKLIKKKGQTVYHFAISEFYRKQK